MWLRQRAIGCGHGAAKCTEATDVSCRIPSTLTRALTIADP